ncbi:ABC transporter permease [Treponema endosymbiont of Eucomonympha sp.]|uniref:ABC transporter permease n=1 Tax=Treponema endosymbiont of Eucomonympha sp. TaxID=1580831 RepID=UPI000B112DAF|nr:ABC transporter permease [Treponema endosymbiont of Eucomonympha sp.]
MKRARIRRPAPSPPPEAATWKRPGLLAQLRWIVFVSRRFSRVDRKSRSPATGVLSALGICLGVTTLLVTLSVMNGFQRAYIDSIMEISSSHIRCETDAAPDAFAALCLSDREVLAATPFYEAQTLMTDENAEMQSTALVRAVPRNLPAADEGFGREARLIQGSFDLSAPDSIVLGDALADALGVSMGSTVSLLALSGGAGVELFSADRRFTVTGIFSSGYSDINAAYAFISLEDGARYFGGTARRTYSVKIRHPYRAEQVVLRLKTKAATAFPENGLGERSAWESWQEYNRSFFGALQAEKGVLSALLFIIYVVVAANIYHGMRRTVFERRAEIAVLSALGGTAGAIQRIFVARGFIVGVSGAASGLALSILVCTNISAIFTFLADAQYALLPENSMYRVYADIPAQMYPSEVLATVFFGVFSAVVAARAASRQVLKLPAAEVLRDE